MPTQPLVLLLGVLLLSACSKLPVHTDTPSGTLVGYVDDDVQYYLGVPYARPPVGDLRWQAPQALEGWREPRQAQDNPPICVQFSVISGAVTGSEDCLYLNIWVPATQPAEPMPVMVWIHGGGFIMGQGSYTSEDGRELALRKDVVVVTLNYRLGIFGFLAHEALTAENPDNPTSGNYGIQDQTAALRWVRDNISAFGGDPDRVTIFGQSAGGISVCAQLASPQAAGLFHGAIIQSGPCVSPMSSLAAVSTLGEQAASSLGCDDGQDTLACLRGASTEDVANTLPPDPTLGFGEDYTLWWPVHDDHVLPLQFTEAFETGRFNTVPVINGSTLNEASLLIWLSHNMRLKPLQAEQYPQRLNYLTGSPELGQRVAQQYPLTNYDSPFEALTEAFSDGFFNCLARRQGQALSQHVPTWSYQFDYQDAPFFIPWADLGAFHSAEIQYVMGRPMSFFRSDFRQEESAMADSMMNYWVQFAATGNPNAPGQLDWPVYDNSDRTLLFNLQNTVAEDVHKDACRFWKELPYLRAPYPP